VHDRDLGAGQHRLGPFDERGQLADQRRRRAHRDVGVGDRALDEGDGCVGAIEQAVDPRHGVLEAGNEVDRP
jgi:hypothetical protein